MSWLELDDGILEHPKFVRAVKLGGSEAVHLWLGIRAYCGKHLTDGDVPEDMMGEVRGPRSQRKRDAALDALVAAGLIERTEDGIRMHDYLQWSTSRDEVLRRRESARERKAKSREESQRDGPRDSSRRHNSVTLPRARDPLPSGSPSPPDPLQDPEGGTPSATSRAPRPWRVVPESWEPNQEHKQIALEMRVNFELELAKFRDHEFTKPKKDADKAFRNWLRGSTPTQANGPVNRFQRTTGELPERELTAEERERNRRLIARAAEIAAKAGGQ